MRIGVDFDNTIICYDKVFHAVAREKGQIPDEISAIKGIVRDYLRKIGREDAWTELQGVVYGTRIKEAPPFPGVFDFFHFCKENKIPIFIISHKTRYPYLGPKYDLHEAAYDWLEFQGFFDGHDIKISRKNVFFELTKEKKINRIEESGCTHFIDDLPEFLAEPSFPDDVDRILFDSNKNHGPHSGFEYAVTWRQVHSRLESELVKKNNKDMS